MTHPDRALLEMAAELLERESRAIKDAHSMHGQWVLRAPCDFAARADHDEMLSVAAELRAAEAQIMVMSKMRALPAEGCVACSWLRAERDAARATIATLTSQLAEAQRLLHRAYPYIEDAQADATSDESLLAIRTLLSDINAAMKDTHGNG